MQVEVKDLEIGDEIIIPSNSNLIYAKVLKAPQPRKTPSYYTNVINYKSIKCSINIQDTVMTRTYNDTNNQPKIQSWKIKKYICTPEEHNVIKHIDLNNKSIWLVGKKLF